MSGIAFPEKLRPLLTQRSRYKCSYGGRGSGKSWSFARALLVLGTQHKLRILCTREVQRSIRDSVHKLLSDQIERMGLGSFYTITQANIVGCNGTEFLFAGLADQTADSIKSYEGVNIVWCEEAQSISKRSWDTLTPTIRAEHPDFGDSEIWISFNPNLDTDETWTRFVENSPPGTVLMPMNYQDNPWFPKVLEQEREHAKATMDPASYENIWEGKCKTAVSGAIYGDEVTQAILDGRICNVPYDPKYKVHVVFDLGWNDATSIILVQKHLSEIRVIGYIEDNRKTLDHYSAELKTLKYNWGDVWLPHDGFHANLQTGMSARQVLNDLGWECRATPNMPIEHGVRVARMVFRKCYFDKVKCGRLVECLRRYRRNIASGTGEPGRPVHDEFSHAADAFRYLAVCAEGMTNEQWAKPISYPKLRIA